MSSVLPQPPEFGLPDKFKEWRPHQESAILSITDTSNDVMHRVLVCPTGFGKSLMYVGAAHMSGMRTCILTSTKALQDQLVSDFGSIGVVDIRGKNNYKCLVVDGSADHGPCGAGEECSYRKSGCPFYDQLRKAMGANIVVTNYAFWLTLNAFSHNDNMGIFDMLVMDEAHNTPDQLMSFLEVQVPKYLVPNPYKDMINTSKKHNPSKLDWSAWLSTVEVALSDTITDEKSRWNSDKSKLVKLRRLVLDIKRAIYNLDNNPDDWEWEIDSNGYSVRFAPITPGKATDVLFSNVTKQYIYTSATVNHKTMEMLGLHKHNYYNSNGDAAFDECDEYSLVEYPHTFPVDNRRVTHIKTVRLDRRSTSGEIGMWLLRINQIVKWRLDRKGIIHTVSYSRMKMVVESLQRDRDISKSGIKIWYHDSKGAAETILRFKHSSKPGILVSPVAATGYDFPESECRYQIIGKLPYPDTRGRIFKARVRTIDEYAQYITMQLLVQASGRGVRSAYDKCETVIIDDNISWFMNQYNHLAPGWFEESYEFSNKIPDPMEV